MASLTRLSRLLLLTLLFLGFPLLARAATLTVCNSGCTYTRAQLQTALDAANPGDTISLEQNFTFVGDFIIPNQKSCPAQDATCIITVKTGVTSTGAAVPNSDFPAANIRIDPSYASKLAKLQPASNNSPVLRTTQPEEIRTNCAAAPCISAWWTFKWLEIAANSYGGFTLMYIGSNNDAAGSPANNPQNTLAEVPHHFIFEQIYWHGNAVSGQLNGMYLNAKDVQVLNGYCADIKYLGSDAQCISYINGPGNLTVTNNYLSASGENILFGGADTQLKQTRVLSASTTTTLTLTVAPVDLVVGQPVACQVGGTTQDKIRASNVTNIAGSVLTVSPAFSVACDVPGSVEWNPVPTNGTIAKNWMAKDANWRNPITPTPQSVVVTTSATGGTFAAATYYYRVVAKTTVAGGGIARSTASAEQSIVTTGTTSSNTITWNPVPNASYYHVFGRSSGGENFRVYLVASSCGATCSVIDTNATTSGACGSETATGCTENVPTSTGSLWTVKNIFEIKNWDGMTVQGNVFDYVWKQSQSGVPLMFTVINQDGTNYGNTVANIMFRDSKVRHANGGFTITGTNADNKFAQISHDITLQNLVFEDLGDSWNQGGDTARTGLFTGGLYPALTGPNRVTINHITAFQTGGPSTFSAGTYCGGCGLTDLVIKNSMFRKLFYASIHCDGCSTGNAGWVTFALGNSVWTKNVTVDQVCSSNPSPSTNYCPTEAAWESEFVDYAGGNFRLKGTSTYRNAGDDGTDLGANIDAIEAFTNIALSGNNSGGAPPPVPTISTASPLAQASVGTAYSQTLVATNGTAPYTWTITAGTLPTGLILSTAGVLSGTPTAATLYNFTITVTDSLGQTASKAFALTVIQPVYPDPRPDKLFYNEGVHFRRNAAPDLVDQVRVGDLWSDLTTSILKTATSTSPSVTWSPIMSVNTLLHLGNAFGATLTFGTTDNQNVDIITNGTARWRVRNDGAVGLNGAPVMFNTAPTISSGFGTSPTIVSGNGTATFRVNVGTGGTANTGIVGLPTATNGWNCLVNNFTAMTTVIFISRVTANDASSVTVSNFDNTGTLQPWGASNKLVFLCAAY